MTVKIVKAVPVVAKVTTTVKPADAQPTTAEVTEQVMLPMLTDHPLCAVGVTLEALIPTAKFANIRVGVQLSMPCEKDAIEAAYAFAKYWCDGKLIELTSELASCNG
jgi:hypothetical protein